MGLQALCIIEMEEREKVNPPATVFEHRFFSENNDNQITARLFFFNASLLTAPIFGGFVMFFGGVGRWAVRVIQEKMIKKKKRLQNIKLKPVAPGN